MECRECGADISIGSFFCGGCGRPVGIGSDPDPRGTADGPAEIPDPGLSREPRRGRSGRGGHFLCSGCLGAFPESEAVLTGTGSFCRPCAAARAPVDRSSGLNVEHLAGPGLLVRERDLRGRGRLALMSILVAALAVGVCFAIPWFASGDRIDALTKPADGGDCFEIVRRYVPGSRSDWDMRFRMEMEGGGAGTAGFGEAQIELLVAGSLSEEVLEVDPEGSAEVRALLRDATPAGRVVVNGTEIALGEMVKNLRLEDRGVRLRLDRRGELVEVLESEDGGEEGGEDPFPCRLCSVPPRPLAVGDEWHAAVPLPLSELSPGGHAAPEVELRFRMEGFLRHAGRACAVVSVRGEVDTSLSTPLPGGPMELGLEAVIKGVHYLEIGTGTLVKSAMDLRIRGLLAGPGGSAEFTTRMELDLVLR